jgi:hypothetical protein
MNVTPARSSRCTLVCRSSAERPNLSSFQTSTCETRPRSASSSTRARPGRSDRAPDPEQIGGMSAYEMAATVEFGLDAKQGLLDLRSESARLRLVTRLFRAAIKRLDFVNRAQARARSNGRVHFGG